MNTRTKRVAECRRLARFTWLAGFTVLLACESSRPSSKDGEQAGNAATARADASDVVVDDAEAAATFDSQDFEALLARLADGWNTGNARAAAECFTEDAIYVEPPNKQEYRGRAALFEFFGGDSGRAGAMSMTWHHLAFDAESQVGAGEFTFRYGSAVHGVAMIQVRDGRISRWREYWYASDLDWEDFVGASRFESVR